MTWSREMASILSGDPKQRVYHATPPESVPAAGGPLQYRVYWQFNRTAKHNGSYRVEYRLETGWWPLGMTELHRDAIALAETDVKERML